MMEMTAGYHGQAIGINKMMAMQDIEDHRRNSNRHPPISATLSTGQHSLYGSNGELRESLSVRCI
jgi:hypothetical protein